MFCPYCGNNIEDNLMTCPVCGSPTALQAQQPTQNQYNPNVIQQPAQNQTVFQQPYVNQYQTNPYNGMQGFMGGNQGAILDYADEAKSIRNLGIVAAILMFGIGFILSIIVFVKSSKLKEPQLFNPTPDEIAQIEAAKKKLKTAKILAILPFVACGLSFIISFVTSFLYSFSGAV